jgi:hypothetical protein
VKKSRPAPKDVPESSRQSTEKGKAAAKPEPVPEKPVPLFLRVSPALYARLKRASLQRQLDKREPWRIQAITAQALERWLDAEDKKAS